MRLHDFLEYRARIQPQLEFATLGERTLSYAEADREANRIAHALLASGLERGDRVAVLAQNCIEYVLFYYAASKAGVVPVPLNYRLAPPEWAWIIDNAEAVMLVARGGLAQAVDSVRDGLPGVKRWIALGAELRGWERWEDFLAGQPETPPRLAIAESDDLYQMYTSGTTGRPKGAVISQSALCQNMVQTAFEIRIDPGERSLIVAPLYHAAACIVAFNTVFGGGSLYIQEEFDPVEVVRALSEERVGMALLVPAMIQFCLVHVPEVRERSYEHLKLMVYGASPIAEQTLRDAIETFGCGFLQGYGMTELTAVATNLYPADHERALAEKPELLLSAGRAVAGTEVRVVDDEDRELPTGQIGEVIVRGPQVMKGYWRNEKATAEALREGWMHTGDAGILDEEGYLYIQDRVKDMIVSGGENVYPREIEEVLYQHPAVAEAAVIGVPDEQWGEAVKAIVVLKEGASASADELLTHCKGRLGGYKRPRSLDFIEALPRNLSGKVLKRELREPYWKDRGRRVN